MHSISESTLFDVDKFGRAFEQKPALPRITVAREYEDKLKQRCEKHIRIAGEYNVTTEIEKQ